MLRTMKVTGAVLGVLLLSANSFAMGVDFEPVVGTISGTDTIVIPFEVTEAGSYEWTLTDLASPAPFSLLGLAFAAESSGVVFADVVGIDRLQLAITVDAGQYLAIVGGIAGGDLNIGTFGLEISNVPLPGAALLLTSGIMLAGGLMRSRQSA